MPAPDRYAEWMSGYRYFHKKSGVLTPFRYHPRSNAPSLTLARLVLQDLYEAIPGLRARAQRGEAAYGVNMQFTFEGNDKAKQLDLAVGVPMDAPLLVGVNEIPEVKALSRLFAGMEAKAAMTEHVGAKPRLWDELSSSHQIVHAGDQQAIAAGITVINVAKVYASPTNQRDPTDIHWQKHNQPHAAEDLRKHLLKLPVRNEIGQIGFDAYCTIMIDCDNIGPCTVWTEPPAPQPGEPDEYREFVKRIAQLFARRFP
jgi:hypothetical protein